MTSLLESAGFSKSNPYYIVQQGTAPPVLLHSYVSPLQSGKVANLCTMKDADRLQLLKEVAGTSIYEERRAESTKILAETVLKRDEVQRILDFIEKRLTELEHEKEELTEYEQLDKQQKAIEYNVFTHEQATAKAHLESIVQQIDNHSTSLNTLHSGLGSCQEDMATEETQLSDMKTRARKLENKLVSKRKQRNEYEIDRDDKSELRLDYENKESMKEREVEDNNNMLKQINSNITAKEAELAAVNQDITRVTTEMSGYSNQLTSLQSKLEILVNKKNANKLYSTKKERDAYITNNINSINSTIDKKETILHDYVNQMQSLQQALQNSQAKLQRDEKEHADNDRRYNTLIAEINRKIAERNALQDNRKANWATIDALTDEVAKLEQESTNSRNNLNKTLPYAVAQGLNIIEGIVRKHNIQGYYGPLIDNIQIRNEAFYTVLDKAGGNALFNIVVDTDATANVLINHLEEFKVGRLTFVPLNRIRANRKETPRSGAVRSLMESALEYEDYMEPAVHLVFGNKLLTQTLEDAAAAAREFQMDTYTMEGDVVSARGALEGGYHNVKFNRINAIMTIREVTERINSKNDQIEKIKRNHTALEEQINALMREIRQQEIEKDHLSDNNNTLYKEISTNKKNIKVLPSNIQGIAAKVQTIENEISNHRQQIAVYQDELRSPFVVTLTEADVANMQAYEQQIRELNQSVGQYNSRLNTLHQAKTAVEQELNQNLYKAKEEVEFKLHDVQTTTAVVKDFSAEIAKLDLEIEHLGRFIESSEAEIKDLEKQMADLSKQITTSESKIDELKSKEQQFTNQIHEVTSSIDNLQAKQGMDLDKIKSTANALKALGMVSLTESTKFARFSSAQLKKHLDAVNEKLKKYSSVNRKALDQYLSFAGQKEELFKRRNELDNDSNSINLMMQSLDTQKDESIVTTCNNVNQHFINVFAELVPSGKAKLRPILAMDMEGEVEGMDAVDAGNLGNIRGISVEVSFTKNAKGEYIYHSMASLSGGQKALVALALIFAIQRCDPAPFYLFDEIGKHSPIVHVQ